MSNSIPNSSLYQFLARVEFNKNGKTWVDTADGEYGNKDGVVTYNEFVNFLNVNWDNESYGALNNDIVKRFWSTIDSDTKGDIVTDKATRVKDLNALNKDEMKALEDDLEKYRVLNKLIEDAESDCPAELKYTNWKQYVKEALTTAMEAYIDDGGDVKNLEKHLRGELSRIEAEVTAKVQADYEIENLKKGILKDLDKYGYDIENDPELAQKIDMYISGGTVTVTVKGKTEYVSIKNPDGSYKSVKDVQADIVKIIKSRLEEVGIDSETGDPIAPPTDNTDPTVDTTPGIGAIAALKKELAEALTQLIKNTFDGTLEDSYLMLVDDYINKKGINASNYQEIKDLLAKGGLENDFKTVMEAEIEEAGKTAKSLEALNTFINGQGQTLISELMPLLNTKFGGTILAIVLDSPEYKTILNNAKNDIDQFKDDKGGIDANKFAEYLSAKISTVLGDILQNGYDLDNPTVDNLNQAQESAGKVAEGIEDPNARTVQYAKLVEGYLYDISNLSEAHEEAVNKVFTQGTDYESIMKQFDSLNDIKKAVKELKKALNDVVDLSGVKFNNIPQQQCSTGQTHTINTSLENPNNVNITYELQGLPNGVEATVDKMNGAISFKANEEGYYEITVVAKSGDKVVTNQKISIKVTEAPVKEFNEVSNNLAFKGTKLKDLLTATSANGINLSGWKSLEEAKSAAISNITNVLEEFGQLLIDFGMSKSKVKSAVDATISLYTQAINCMYDITDDGGKTSESIKSDEFDLSYDSDGDGKVDTTYEDFYFGFYGRKNKDDIDIEKGDGIKKSTDNLGLRLEEAHNGNKANEYIIGVNTAALVKTFKQILENIK